MLNLSFENGRCYDRPFQLFQVTIALLFIQVITGFYRTCLTDCKPQSTVLQEDVSLTFIFLDVLVTFTDARFSERLTMLEHHSKFYSTLTFNVFIIMFNASRYSNVQYYNFLCNEASKCMQHFLFQLKIFFSYKHAEVDCSYKHSCIFA